jgi:hypothetical protein
MNMNDCVVLFQEALTERQKLETEHYLRQLKGMIAVRFNHKSSRILQVCFDANQLSGKTMIDGLRKQGRDAVLAGL